MKTHSFWLKTVCIISIPFFLFYLYQFGYMIVDKAYSVNRLNNNLDQSPISGHNINYLELVSPAIIGFLLLIVLIGFTIGKNAAQRERKKTEV